jgi:hypothetical protein
VSGTYFVIDVILYHDCRKGNYPSGRNLLHCTATRPYLSSRPEYRRKWLIAGPIVARVLCVDYRRRIARADRLRGQSAQFGQHGRHFRPCRHARAPADTLGAIQQPDSGSGRLAPQTTPAPRRSLPHFQPAASWAGRRIDRFNVCRIDDGAWAASSAKVTIVGPILLGGIMPQLIYHLPCNLKITAHFLTRWVRHKRRKRQKSNRFRA